ncbi:MAG: single-stranded-DNA-specific exonuclease RecJ, partial [Terriglobales bacterium]
ESVQRLEPFGMGNPEPVFVARGARVAYPPKILKEKHVKMRLAIGAGTHARGIDALGWRMAEQVQRSSILAGDAVDVAFTLELNDHPEFGGLELRLEDIVRVKAEVAATMAT